MKERPIIFNDAMVRAILEGRKTQTRRTVKPQPESEAQFSGWIVESSEAKREGCAAWHIGATAVLAKRRSYARCPFGQPGDRLWVREPLQASDGFDSPIQYVADGDIDYSTNWVWKRLKLPAMLCPRGMSRITLKITGVRVERLKEICTSDAWAEGVSDEDIVKHNGSVEAFSALWQSIYGAESWQSNPWVWVVEFRRVCA